jgi:lipopolysaccharide transport system ATP-binding protein
MRGRVSSLLEVGTGFHPELTGRENVYLNGTILGMTKREIDRKFDEIVAFSGVEHFLDTPVKRYSSGMKVRLAFAVAAHLEPDILIVDEVLAVGDAEFQRKCVGKMGDVAKGGGRTVLLVSHNMASIMVLAQDCLYLDQGRVAAYGPADEVVDHYMAQFGRSDSTEPGLFVPKQKPDQKLIVKSLEVFSRRRRTDTIRMGDDLSLLVTLDFEAQPASRSLRVGFGIETVTGLRIISLGSRQGGLEIATKKGAFEIRCDVGNLPLNHGQYAIRVALAESSGSLIEVHESLGMLHVLPTDVFSNGVILGGHQGFFYWMSDWSLESSPRGG